MRDRLPESFDWGRWLADRLAGRAATRYRNGIDVKHAWAAAREVRGQIFRWIAGQTWFRRIQSGWRELGRQRVSRVGGGIEGIVFGACLAMVLVVRLSVRDSVSAAPAKTLVMKAAILPEKRLDPIPAEPALLAISPVPAGNGAPLNPPPQPAVDPASKIKLEYAYARERCLARLRATERYQRVKQNLDLLETKVLALRESDARNELPSISLRWITAKSELSAMTQAALKSDPDVQSAESVLRAAGFIQPVFPMRASPSDPEKPALPSGSDETAASN